MTARGSATPGDEPQAAGRSFETALPAAVLDGIQNGALRSLYRGVPFMKSPLDIGLYLQLLSRLAPRSVIEIGSWAGGSALWFADMLEAQRVESPRVISVDLVSPATYTDPRIQFISGDVARLDEALTPALLADCPRPWLVVEDSSHTYPHVSAALRFFDDHLEAGDYMVVEDGVVAHLSDARYAVFENGPNRAVADFLATRGDRYAVDAELCDFYGRNATYNPNGWLRRT